MFRSTLHLFLYLSRSLKTLANLENILCDSMGENLKFESDKMQSDMIYYGIWFVHLARLTNLFILESLWVHIATRL